MHQCLERLDPRCRELITALFLESAQMTYEKLAKRLGVPLGSIGPTRARCFKKLETIMLKLGIDASL